MSVISLLGTPGRKEKSKTQKQGLELRAVRGLWC